MDPPFYLPTLSLVMRHHISSHSLGHQSHCPLPWMPSNVCLLVGDCEDTRIQYSWPRGPLLTIGC
uniref:Neural cell expressed developmentally down-regulated protein 8 n=1 Tax=Homo sapiens TaxID=9606 RepID=Q96L81_HUMAN|nr:neural precursor cell expressed developmentally down-regulated protein 8 [Homo sapiens]